MMVEQNGQGRPPASGEGTRLLNLVGIAFRRWRTVAGVTVAALLGALVMIGFQREAYVAHTILIPSTPKAGGSQSPGAQFAFGLVAASNSGQELIGVIARSRRLADAMVERLAARGLGGPKIEREIREALGRVDLGMHADGSIYIGVASEDPRLPARIANEYPGLINGILGRISAQSARRRQEFLEEQLVHARARLERSEEQLIAFQKGQNAPELKDQAQRALDAAAAQQTAIIEQELRVAQLRRTATPDNPELRAAVAELNARREQLRRLTAGGRGAGQLFPSLRAAPALKTASARLMRDFTRNEQIYLSLTAALADAQIEADRVLPVVSVLDPAIKPTAPVRRSIMSVLGIAVVLGFLLGLVAVYVSEYTKSARRDPENEPFFDALDEFRTDVSRFVPFRRKDGNGRLAGTNTGG